MIVIFIILHKSLERLALMGLIVRESDPRVTKKEKKEMNMRYLNNKSRQRSTFEFERERLSNSPTLSILKRKWSFIHGSHMNPNS
jgi:hypothetical protein